MSREEEQGLFAMTTRDARELLLWAQRDAPPNWWTTFDEALAVEASVPRRR